MTSLPTLLPEGVRMGWRSVRRGILGHKRYRGNAQQICEQVVRDCWNGTCFVCSTGHFRQFWVRDLGMCAPALIRLGYKKEVRKTLEWALSVYERAGKVTTTIFEGEKPLDIYSFASDSFPFLLFSLKEAGMENVEKKYKTLLNKEITRYAELIFDESTGLVRTGRYFPGAKDCMKGSSTTYANTMAAFLSMTFAEYPFLRNPFSGIDLKKNMMRSLWRGDHFADDMSGDDIVSGDANLWPFWTGVCDSKEMKRSAFARLRAEGLDSPFPLKYTKKRYPAKELFYPRIMTPNYQGNTIWMQVGPLFITLLRETDKERAGEHVKKYTEVIERDGTYFEIYREDGLPYTGRFGIYRADEGMVWASLFLDLFT